MILRADNSLTSSYSIAFLSIKEPSIIHPKNPTGWVWMKGMKDEKYEESEEGDTEKMVPCS